MDETLVEKDIAINEYKLACSEYQDLEKIVNQYLNYNKILKRKE